MPRKNNDLFNEWRRGYYAGLRRAIIMLLGDICQHCGETDLRVIQIDHVKGGGSAHRRVAGSGPGLVASIIRDIRARGRGRYQLLCANCNQRKRHTHKEGVK